MAALCGPPGRAVQEVRGMKGKSAVLWVLVLLLGASFACSGCAAINKRKAANTEELLSSVGFVPKQPVKPEDIAKLEKVDPLKLYRAVRGGQVIYVYPDPYNCKCVYVGNEQQYQEYKILVMKRQAALEPPYKWESDATGGVSENFWW
jgi:hypothetical protein